MLFYININSIGSFHKNFLSKFPIKTINKSTAIDFRAVPSRFYVINYSPLSSSTIFNKSISNFNSHNFSSNCFFYESNDLNSSEQSKL